MYFTAQVIGQNSAFVRNQLEQGVFLCVCLRQHKYTCICNTKHLVWYVCVCMKRCLPLLLLLDGAHN